MTLSYYALRMNGKAIEEVLVTRRSDGKTIVPTGTTYKHKGAAMQAIASKNAHLSHKEAL